MQGIVSEHFDTDAVVHALGDEWHLMQNYFKLHSCCRFNHGTLDAIDQIATRGALPAPERIASIAVTSYAYAAELDDPAPTNTLGAKFSVPFAVATRIVNGSSALASFSWDAVRDPRVAALARKVSLREDPAMTRRLPLERPARVIITLDDGSTLQGEVGANRGDDALPYSRDELRGKFMDLTTRVWPAEHAQAVLQATLDLARAAGSLPRWAALLARAPQA
jgi:2-methylcitrate dehydratase PrpD